MSFSMPLKMRRYRVPNLPLPRDLMRDHRADRLREFMGQSKRLVCEIGCGVGLHPLMYALEHQGHSIVAIERTKEKFEKFQRRFLNHQSPKNLFPVHADVEAVFNHFFMDNSIDELFLMYPNPEIKNPSRRWIRMPFFELILSKMKQDGEILFVTNEASYFEELRIINQQVWNMAVVKEQSFSIKQNPNFKPRTHFEKKYFMASQTIFEIRFRKEYHGNV